MIAHNLVDPERVTWYAKSWTYCQHAATAMMHLGHGTRHDNDRACAALETVMEDAARMDAAPIRPRQKNP